MSGPIRRLLAPTKAELSQYLSTVPQYSELPDGVDSLRELRKELKHHIKRISRLTDLISKKNEEWTQLIQRSVPARAKEEEELHEETTKGAENFLEIWLQGQEKIEELQENLEEVNQQLRAHNETPSDDRPCNGWKCVIRLIANKSNRRPKRTSHTTMMT
ncbi:hypothetical protein Tcan_07207 [Toxocara canis]|uniref:Uncharacterized protein n=1 Tax=Toxocara canis TaxID=6265 RepID=A0A0B2VJG1_TOXCA|nr:hypothetical protein Tcan_07207 [Toxocara canis]